MYGERRPEFDPNQVLNNFSAPIRLALKFARIYENLPTAKEGMDVDAILAEVEAYEQRKESKLSDLSGLRNV